MKGRNIPYSAEEMAWLEANRLMVISAYHAAFCATFGRADASLVNLHALRKRKGWSTGRTGCFAKGDVPVNKGKPCEPGRGGRHPNARKTQFRHGERSGVALKLWKPVGTERLSKDGYLERKIHDGMPPQSRWRAVHLINWEAVNGPLPKGIAIKCIDGNRANLDPSNWEAIPRAMLPKLNGGRAQTSLGYDAAPAELRPTIMALAKLDHAARCARKPHPQGAK